MSDEQPEEEGAASGAPDASDTPDDELDAADADEAHADATEPAAATPAPPGGPPATTGGWMIPKWLVVSLVAFVAVCVLAGGSFAIGRATASSGGSERREHAEREFPDFPGRPGNGNGNGNGQLPRPTSGVFLGVSTEAAGGGQQGAQVANVLDGSPASQAGLQAGDVITAVDGTAVTSPSELAQRIRSHQSGDQVTITYSRSGASNDVQVQLANRSAENTPNS